MGFSRLYVRKLTILVAAIGITVLPSFVYGLGLGAIKLNSSLSEILDAEIDLVAATPSDVSDLKVKLASNEAFLRAGIDRTSLLTSLRFSVKRHNTGKYYIKITSRKPIREPFLNFLLEVNWKNGRMLREYTMLIDPPGRRVQQVQQSTIQAPETIEVTPEPSTAIIPETPEASPFVGDPAPVAKPQPDTSDIVDQAYINDTELFPHRSIDDVPAAKKPELTEPVVEKVAEPEAVIPEPVIPEPEPVIPVIAPESVTADSKGISGKVRDEHSKSGQVIEEKDLATDEMAAKDTFAEGELFPSIPLTEYDESKSIQYDEEPVSAADVAQAETQAELMGGSDAVETGDLDYGITKKTDNLWTIASKMKTADTSVYQVMMALLKSNPKAFTDGNVHRLKVGQVLRIDDPALITAISEKQAAQEYITQTEAWDAYRQQVAAAAEQQPLTTGEIDSTAVDNIAEAPSGELTLSAPDGDDLSAASTAPSQDASGQEVARLKGELENITQQANAERGKNSALNERLRALETELETLQRSLSVRNDELAALQQQLAKASQTEPVQSAAVPEPASEPVSELEPEVAQTPTPVQPEVQPETSAPQLEDEPVASTPEVAEPAQVEPAPVTQEQPPVAVEPTPPVAAEPPPPAQVSTSLVDTIMSTVMGILKPVLGSSMLLFVGVPVLAVVLIILVILMLRKRSSAKENFQESILSGAAPVDDEPAVAVNSQDSSETSSFLSDFAISGVGAIQTEDSEVDPLTEADVFMAYGRYEAAEERLQEAITADPERQELKVKLLEVYNTNKNQPAFESTAEELFASMGDAAATDPNWQKVVVMGKQIAPDNPIFSAAPTVTTETTESVLGEMEENLSNVSMTDSQVMDIGLETGVFSAEELSPDEGASEPGSMAPEVEQTEIAQTEADMGSLDFNLGDDVPVTDQQETQDNINQPDELDFNLGGGDEPAELTEAVSKTESDGLDFSLDMDESNDDESTKSMAIDLNAMELGDTEMAADNSDDEPTASMMIDEDALDLDSTSAQLDTGALDFSLDDVDLTAGIDTATDSAEDSLDLNLDAGDAVDMSLSADTDEVGTKLDLAKAYIDMGDSAGAKSILDEVLDEGNDDQKQEAEQLVSQLS